VGRRSALLTLSVTKLLAMLARESGCSFLMALQADPTVGTSTQSADQRNRA
jgi:hypothetical protein